MSDAPRGQQQVAGANGAQQQQRQHGLGGVLQGILRMAMMWYFFKQFSGGNKPKPDSSNSNDFFSPMLSRETPLDVHFYLTDDSIPVGWRQVAAMQEPLWVARGVPIATGKEQLFEYTYKPSDKAQNNGTVLVHTVFTPQGGSANEQDDDFDAALTWGFTRPLNVYLPKRKAGEGIKLLSGKNSTDGEPMPDDMVASNVTEIVSYLKPNVTVNFVDEFGTYPKKQIPPHLINLINPVPDSNMYTPHVYFNDFWLLRDYLIPMNETVKEQKLFFVVGPIAGWKAHLMLQMENSFKLQEQWGMSSTNEADEVKRIFLEGNPIFLGITVVVSMLHSLFDVLAFKNDIGFWKDNKSMKGLSARSILINAVCQMIVFLYLMDNDTSTVVLISSFVGTLIEFWKVTKAMDVSIKHTTSGIPYLSFKDKQSYVQSQTDKYDAEAMRYMSYVLYPLVGGYAVYALVYQTHKSWYSWILNSLVGAVYTFGFILMIPQLYLNYKLKSVAHLPWRQMTYKFLNTIIDDLFAFVIKMPLLHRLSVFRDDLVFLVYLYQRWIYRVDKTRANEFGYVEKHEASEMTQEESTAQEQESTRKTEKPDESAIQAQAEPSAAVESEERSSEKKQGPDDSNEGISSRKPPTAKSQPASQQQHQEDTQTTDEPKKDK